MERGDLRAYLRHVRVPGWHKASRNLVGSPGDVFQRLWAHQLVGKVNDVEESWHGSIDHTKVVSQALQQQSTKSVQCILQHNHIHDPEVVPTIDAAVFLKDLRAADILHNITECS